MFKSSLILSSGLVLLSCLSIQVRADLTAPTPAPALLDQDSYSVQPSDVMSLTVIGFTDLTVPQVVVLPDGSITVPLLGKVNVQGMTPLEIEQLLTKKYSAYVINPSVSVSLLQQHPQYVTFTGYVAKPGSEPYHPNYHILQALADSGGIQQGTIEPNGMSLPSGDLSKVTVTHTDDQTQVLDLSHPERKAGTSSDILLSVGDVVYVPELRDEISVVGEVTRPGSYPYQEGETVLDALTAAGSTLDDADLTDATLLHNGTDSQLNLDALMRHGDLTQNVVLSAGDRISVPEGNRTYVYGAVSKPGYYTLKPGDTILDALNAAGGPAAAYTANTQPDLAKINLIRTNKAKKTATVYKVDLQKYFNKGDMADDVTLDAGDVLYVPTKSHKFSTSDLSGILTGAETVLYGNSLLHTSF